MEIFPNENKILIKMFILLNRNVITKGLLKNLIKRSLAYRNAIITNILATSKTVAITTIAALNSRKTVIGTRALKTGITQPNEPFALWTTLTISGVAQFSRKL